MKPKRGSNRDASNVPNVPDAKRKTKAQQKTRKEAQESQEVEPRAKRSKLEPAQDEKGSSAPKRGQEKWGLMPRSSIVALENILDLSIISTLALRHTSKTDVQEHLDTVKKRFLAQCAQLRVPVQRRNDPEPSSQRHRDEAQRSLAGQQSLSSLEESLSAALSALERTEDQISTLQHNCRKLREKLEDEEEKASELFQLPEQAVLDLPPLARRKNEETLEARMRDVLSDVDAESFAEKLGEVLQTSDPTRDHQALLQQANKYAHQLFNPRVV
ncbi:centromere protein Q [Genypterus blacodes]|uniref:centromere protein Q n=1 Tax=Genypterus blacodes TaxID=154954 RepID=UPI003F76FE53